MSAIYTAIESTDKPTFEGPIIAAICAAYNATIFPTVITSYAAT